MLSFGVVAGERVCFPIRGLRWPRDDPSARGAGHVLKITQSHAQIGFISNRRLVFDPFPVEFFPGDGPILLSSYVLCEP